MEIFLNVESRKEARSGRKEYVRGGNLPSHTHFRSDLAFFRVFGGTNSTALLGKRKKEDEGFCLFGCKSFCKEDSAGLMGRIRIISGQFGGRWISGPPSGVEVRPMFNRVKESLFNILREEIPGKKVLDLCAGTGSIGIEALSHGAESVLFVEKERRNISVIHDNLASLNIQKKANILQGELPQVLTKLKGTFDLVFIDPPFRSDVVFSILPVLLKQRLLLAESLLVVQRARNDREVVSENYVLTRKHEIGDSELFFLSPELSSILKEKENE